MGNKQVVASELVFGEPDDPLIMGTARRMLSVKTGWVPPAMAPRGDVEQDVPAVTPRGDGESDGSEKAVKQEQSGVIDGPPDNGPDMNAVDLSLIHISEPTRPY